MIERPSVSTGGKLLIFGIELQTWVFVVVNILALASVYFSLRNDVDNLIEHEKNMPVWAVQMNSRIENIQNRQSEVISNIAAFNSGGSEAFKVISEQLSSIRENNTRQDRVIEQMDSQMRDYESILRYFVQYFGAHPDVERLKKGSPKKGD